MPIMRYSFGIIKWTQTELRVLDSKTRKILSKYKFHHPKSNLHCLYSSRKNGGRGLIGLVDCHRQECSSMAEYLSKSEDPLSIIARDIELTKNNSIMSYLNENKKGNAAIINVEHIEELKKMNLH